MEVRVFSNGGRPPSQRGFRFEGITRGKGGVLVRQCARAGDADGGEKLPAGAAGLRAREARHRPDQGLQGMCRRQGHPKAAGIELAVALGVLDRGRAKDLDPAKFLALRLAEPVETVNKPGVF